MPDTSAQATGDLVLICLDEFQDLLLADDKLDGLLRSVIQHHGQRVAYVFAGSQPSLMRALFADHERPFYGQARPLDLPPLPVAEAAADILELLSRDGLAEAAGSAVDELLAFSGGHPQRTMLLAHHLYEILDAGGTDDPSAAAVEAALRDTRDAHQALWDVLPRSERLVCIALADGTAPTGTRVSTEHRVGRSTLQQALARMLADGRQVTRTENGRAVPAGPTLRRVAAAEVASGRRWFRSAPSRVQGRERAGGQVGSGTRASQGPGWGHDHDQDPR